MKELIATMALLIIVPALALAQNTENQYRGQGYFIIGMGTGLPTYFHPFIVHEGGGGEGFLYKGLGIGAEAGHASWGRSCCSSAWIASGDLSYHFGRHARPGRADPFVLIGPSFVGPTQVGRGSLAGNFGGGASFWLAKHAALRLEFRDIVAAQYWAYTHYLSFRVGVTVR